MDYSSKLATGEPLAGILSDRTPLVWANSVVACDSPEKKQVLEGSRVGSVMYKPVAEAVSAVRTELLMITPYFVPSKGERRLLDERRSQGARVAILTNSLESAPDLSAQSGYMHYRPALLAQGVELYEVRARLDSVRGSGQSARISRYGNYALHGKLIVFDRERLFVGSMNFDQRSRNLNTEIGLIIDSPELAQQVVSRFDAMTRPESSYAVTQRVGSDGRSARLIWRTRKGDRLVDYDTEPARSRWQRLKVYLLSLLPLDHEL